MAHADNLPKDVIDAVAAQIGANAGRAFGPNMLQAKSVELTESFAIWALGADAITKSGTDLSLLAHQTGRWHHQIKLDGKPELFARSMPLGPEAANWSVREMFASSVAKKIDDAIDWVDRNVKIDPLVRLLIVPAYHLHAFWLKEGEGSQVLVVDMPQTYTKLQGARLYTAKEFLDTLAQEQHIVGLSR